MTHHTTDTVTEEDIASKTTNNGTLNKLRAAVLGANDGIVSVSSLVMGVAGAGGERGAIFVAGMAALVAGALSMAVGEYVSVSSQSDAEKAYIDKEKQNLKDDPTGSLEELTREYVKHGVSEKTAHVVAAELTKKDALKAHLRMHFNLDPDDINSPMHAAVSSLVAFSIGGLIPFLAIILVPAEWRLVSTSIAVVVALLAVGYLSAVVGGASRRRAMTRVLVGGLAAMFITYFVGILFGASVV